jgi:hypothetical protein
MAAKTLDERIIDAKAKLDAARQQLAQDSDGRSGQRVQDALDNLNGLLEQVPRT